MGIDDLPTMAEVEVMRRGKPISKGPSRLEIAIEVDRLKVIDEKVFRKAVYDRDGAICRCCGRKVVRTLKRAPERLEIHHIHGRCGDLRLEDKAALVLCLQCHERVTGRVNDRLAIVPTKTFLFKGRELTDARALVYFKKVA